MTTNTAVPGSAWMTQSLLTPSDVSAVLMSAVFKMALPTYPGSYAKNAVRTLLISVIARMVPEWTSTFTSLTGAQKNELVVAILGAAEAMYSKHPALQGAIGQVSIDLLGQELVTLLGMNDAVSVWNYSPIAGRR